MKKIAFLMLPFLFLAIQSNAQVSFSQVSFEGEQLRTIPRLSWNIPIEKKIATKKNIVFAIGGTFKNLGFIYEKNGNRLKHRNLSIGPSAGVYFLMGKKLVMGLGGSVDYNFHYKHKIFPDGQRSDKQIVHREWFSDRVNAFNFIPRFTIGVKEGLMVYGEYFLSDMFNKNYVNAAGEKPYEGYEITRFNIGFSTELSGKFDSNEEIIKDADLSL